MSDIILHEQSEPTDDNKIHIYPNSSDLRLHFKDSSNKDTAIPRTFIKSSAPTVTDDSDSGYAVGDIWVYETGGKLYLALDVTVGYADWYEITGGESKPTANLIINGAMKIAQQGDSATGIASGGYPDGGVDLIALNMVDAGTVTVTQESGTFAAYGLGYSAKYEWTAAKAPLAANSVMALEFRIAGQDLQGFKKGQSTAERFSVGFYAKTNKSGTYIVELVDHDNSRHVAKAYTLTSGTITKVELDLPADTAGAFDNDNAKSLTVQLWLAAGTDYTSGTLATAWASISDANKAVGQVNLADTVGNYIEITGIGLYVGASVPDFVLSKTPLIDVMRYFSYIAGSTGVYPFTGIGSVTSSTAARIVISFLTDMNSSPTISIAGWYIDATAITAINASYLTEIGGFIDVAVSGLTVGDSVVAYIDQTPSAYKKIDARL